MKRPTPLSTFTPGRCFALPPASADGFEESPGRSAVVKTILRPDNVWCVVLVDEDGVEARNGLGAVQTFPGSRMAGEIPRGGFDRLTQLASEAD